MNVSEKKINHILITGGSGFIGAYLADGLIKAGYKVTTVSRGDVRNKNHIRADLTDEETLANLSRQILSVDMIIHCAAIAHRERPPGNISVSEFNTSMSKNVVKAFEKHRPHWVFISSISVYGDISSQSLIPFSQFPKPADSYGLGKLYDERFFISNCRHLDILRLMPVYDKNNLRDIRKRVFLPNTNIKIRIFPEPFYSICNTEEVLLAVKKCVNHKSGQRLTQVGDPQPVGQADLGKLFKGISLPLPQFIFKAVVTLLPRKITFFRIVSLMLKKLGLNNIYEIGTINLGSTEPTSLDF